MQKILQIKLICQNNKIARESSTWVNDVSEHLQAAEL